MMGLGQKIKQRSKEKLLQMCAKFLTLPLAKMNKWI